MGGKMNKFASAWDKASRSPLETAFSSFFKSEKFLSQSASASFNEPGIERNTSFPRFSLAHAAARVTSTICFSTLNPNLGFELFFSSYVTNFIFHFFYLMD